MVTLSSARPAMAVPPSPGATGVVADAILATLPDPVAVLDRSDRIVWVNPAAEQFFGVGAAALSGSALAAHVTGDSPLMALVAQAREQGSSLADHGVDLAGPRIGTHRFDVRVLPILESPGQLVI